MIDGNPICIYSDNGKLTFIDSLGDKNYPLATQEDYEKADRGLGTIFDEDLKPGDNIRLENGYFLVNDDLDLIEDWQII